MSSTILLVKNMVCNRCAMVVENILKKSEIPFQKVIIREIHLQEAISVEKKIKKFVIKKARNEVDEKDQKRNLSEYLSAHMNHEYTYLSSLFSSIEGRTIEKFFIEQRIEKAKELLVYGQHTLSQIAFELEYSSVAHLSSQFKKTTGLTPSFFKSVGASKRKSLDKV